MKSRKEVVIVNYTELKAMTAGKEFPLSAVNEDGENVIVDCGRDEDGGYFRLSALQANGWIRVNVYHEDGTLEEMFER